jgi:hypothetical protein
LVYNIGEESHYNVITQGIEVPVLQADILTSVITEEPAVQADVSVPSEYPQNGDEIFTFTDLLY